MKMRKLYIYRVLGVMCFMFLLLSFCFGVISDGPGEPDIDDTVEEYTKEFTIQLDEVPDEYRDTAEEAGTLTEFWYDTRDYNGDGEEMEKFAIVYTPFGFQETENYNVLYLMHGYGGAATTWLGSPGDETEIKHCIDHMIEDGLMEPLIIVSCTYYDNNEDENTDNYDVYLTEAFSEELKRDIIPSVEAEYPIYADRNHRIFGGFSMGGVTTWYQFLQSMSYFRYYMPLSGSLLWGPDAALYDGGAEWTLDVLKEGLKAQGYTASDFFIYMASGEYDYGRPLLEDQITAMEEDPETFSFGNPSDEGVNCAYGYGSGEDHNAEGRLRYAYNLIPVLSGMMNHE
ncbi:MAG: hypothetical protein E7282_08840 [Lachnospiraceae bacterium]|nr:hypothetical protein [Lachnospiraceae bacterium]